MTKKLLIAVVAIVVLTLGSVYWYQHTQSNTTQPIATSTPTSTPTGTTSKPVTSVATTTNTPATDHLGMKLYRNDQWGFEFWYPNNLVVAENVFNSPSEKFNLEVQYWNKESKHLDVFNVDITPPIFADGFLGIHATTSSVVIGGVAGRKYEYIFETLPEVAVVLPLGQYKIRLGIDGAAKLYGHEDTFNQILSSFRFLK